MTARREDLRRAARLGFGFGLEYADRDAPPPQISADATNHLGGLLDELATAYGEELYGERTEFTPSQLHVLKPYLATLGSAASGGVKAALAFRARYIKQSGVEPSAEVARAWFSVEIIDAMISREQADRIKLRAKAEGRRLTREERLRYRELTRSRRGGIERAADSAKVPASAPAAPRPLPQPYGVSPVGAEEWCAQWLRHLGAADATVTRRSGDGGIDVISKSERWGAQVKHYVGSVSVMEIRELVGACHIEGLRPIFFTAGTYTAAAVEFARRADVILYRYDVGAGTLTAVLGHV